MPSDNTIVNTTLDEDAQAYAEVTENRFGEIMTVQLYVPKNTIIKSCDLSPE